MTDLTTHELDLIVQALEHFAANRHGISDLEIAGVHELSNKLAAHLAFPERPSYWRAQLRAAKALADGARPSSASRRPK